MQHSMEKLKYQQGHVNDQIGKLIISLNRKVLQIANNAATFGEVSSGNSHRPLSRLSRIKFSILDMEDVQRWVYNCEQFFVIDNTIKNLKVKVASIHLSTKALL